MIYIIALAFFIFLSIDGSKMLTKEKILNSKDEKTKISYRRDWKVAGSYPILIKNKVIHIHTDNLFFLGTTKNKDWYVYTFKKDYIVIIQGRAILYTAEQLKRALKAADEEKLYNIIFKKDV